MSTNDFINEYLNKINSLEQTLFSMTGGVTISNTANELSLLDGGVGTKTLATSNLKVGRIIHIDFSNKLSNGNG